MKQQREKLWLSCSLLLMIACGLMFVVINGQEIGQGTAAKDFPQQQRGKVDDDGDDSVESKIKIMQSIFPMWLRTHFLNLMWNQEDDSDGNKKLSREVLLQSLKLGCKNLAENQLGAGNFNYQYDFVKKEMDESDNQVRQAGALWGITLCYQYDPSNIQYKKAVEKGLQFFLDLTVKGPTEGSILVKYLDEAISLTGTNALFGLSMIDYLRTMKYSSKLYYDDVNSDFVSQVQTNLHGIIKYLQYTQLRNKHFAKSYDLDGELKSKHSSSYFDGETMLCLVKAAKYIDGYEDMIPLIENTAPALMKAYTIDVWVEEFDSDETKGFYQWSSMFATEYYQARWKDSNLFGDYVISLGHWIIHTHSILTRRKNTGYAYEGIISAYQVAKSRGFEPAIKEFESVIDLGLFSLTTWQVGGPLASENRFLVENPTSETVAVGGVMNSKNKAPLRIDTTQHQMHAVKLALENIYTE